MNKLFTITLVLCSFMLTSCANPQSTGTNKNAANTTVTKSEKKAVMKNTLKIADYFPFRSNVKTKYTGNGGDSTNTTIYVDYINGDRMQFRNVSPSTSIGYVMENNNGELRLITTREDFYYHEDLTSLQNSNPEIVLKEPLVKGTSWLLPSGKKRYISQDNVSVTTASGKYTAIEVTTETDNGKILDYYAPNVGLVKKVIQGKDSSVITSLESIENDTAATETVKFYYPEINEDKIVYLKKQLQFKTGDDDKALFEKYFKETPSSNLSKIIGPNVKINKLDLDNTAHTVNVDFSKEFESTTSLGAGEEEDVLDCITDTLGDYFNVDKVTITIEGNPYQSGHIIMKPNEAFYVDLKNVQEYK